MCESCGRHATATGLSRPETNASSPRRARERSGSGGRLVGVGRRAVVVVGATVDGGGLVGAVDVVADCLADELHAAKSAIPMTIDVRRTRRGYEAHAARRRREPPDRSPV
jgi:hypothetical protein